MKDSNNKSVQVKLTMSPKTFGLIQKMADKYGQTVAGYVKNLIFDDLKKQGGDDE